MILEIALEPPQTFWNMTMNLLFDAAAVEWSKVFGSYSEDTHWTRVLPAEQHEATRVALHAHLGLMAEQWERERASILAYRDQLVSHHDVNATVEKNPQYDIAFKAACFMFDRIRAVTGQDTLGGIPTDLGRWSKTVAGNMSVIVRKAHGASATLGSNVRT